MGEFKNAVSMNYKYLYTDFLSSYKKEPIFQLKCPSICTFNTEVILRYKNVP